MHLRIAAAVACLFLALPCATAQARTVYECLRNDRLSLSTAPEPGSRCKPKRVNDRKAKVPNFWGDLGPVRGNLYSTRIGGRVVYSTRNIPGWKEVAEPVKVKAPRSSWAHEGLGELGAARVDVFAAQFRDAARRTGVEDAWLRAIAHAESGFDPRARSPKGALGVMQLMPVLAREYGVADPYSSAQSIDGAARHIRSLMRRYKGDLVLVAAAYNAGIGAVERYGGVPPYAETEAYVEKVQALVERYRSALRKPSRRT
jgi:soluble lytic murein transglycosylase-like protein